MAFIKPNIMFISAFDASEDKVIEFVAQGGDQYTHIEALITQDNISKTITYNTFGSSFTIPANTLVNNAETSKVIMRVGDGVNWSQWSQESLFQVSSRPNVGIKDVYNQGLKNSSYTFRGTYTQSEGVQIQSFYYTLYDANGDVIKNTPASFSPVLDATIGGFENNTEYNISLTVTTEKGVSGTSPLYPFLVSFFEPQVYSSLELSVDPEYCDILIEAGLRQIRPTVYDEFGNIVSNPEYVDYLDPGIGERQIAIRPPTNGRVDFNEGLDVLKENYTIKLFFRIPDVTIDTTVYELIGSNGVIYVYWDSKTRRFICIKQTADGIKTVYVTDEFATSPDNSTFHITMKHINNNIDIFATTGGVSL